MIALLLALQLSGASIEGIRPEILDGHTVRFYEGSASVGGGLGLAVIPHPYSTDSTYLEVDVFKVGLNGRDGGGLEDGHFYFYVLKSDTQTGIVASRAEFYRDVILPPGGPWMARKLPYGHPYRAIFGGFPPVHVSGWPQPSMIFTGAQYSGAWMALANGVASTWAAVSLQNWIPDNARLGNFIFEVRDRGQGLAGSCYVRSYGGQNTGVLVGSTSPLSPFAFLSIELRTNSNREIEYKCTAGVRLFIQVRGYAMTEPS